MQRKVTEWQPERDRERKPGGQNADKQREGEREKERYRKKDR